MTRFGQQEQADLCDVRAGGDVNEILFRLGVERVGPGEIVQRRVDLLEVPGVFHRDQVGAHLGLGRDRGDVGGHQLGQLFFLRPVEQFEAVDQQVLVLADRDARPPRAQRSAPCPASNRVPSRPITTCFAFVIIHTYKLLSTCIVLQV